MMITMVYAGMQVYEYENQERMACGIQSKSGSVRYQSAEVEQQLKLMSWWG